MVHSAALLGDHPGDLSDVNSESIFAQPFPEQTNFHTEEPPMQLVVEQPVIEKPVVEKIKVKTPVQPFTGRVKKNKVRLRLQPNTDSPVIKELEKGALLLVTGELDDFWAVTPTNDLKAYVFRSFVLDNQIEGNRVNVRLEPHTEAPILAHLNAGDHVDGTICASSNKWLEITPPPTVQFYIAKNYVENLGGPEVKVAYETKYTKATQELALAKQFAETEIQKSFPNIDFDKMHNNFQTISQEYTEFPELIEQAQELLVKTQEQFLDKRISYLESKTYEEEALAAEVKQEPSVAPTDKMKLWAPIEEALYLSWVSVNDSRDMNEYYQDQRLAAAKISGILEPYLAPVKSKPGDYFIKQDGLPVGYVYSTKINLQEFVGKKVNCIAFPRPNNNFAFPAYFVIEVEN